MRKRGRRWEKEYSRRVEAVDWATYKSRDAIDQKVVCLLTAILNDQEDEIDRLYGVIDRLVRKMRRLYEQE